MKTFEYVTGRIYNGDQTLVISHKDVDLESVYEDLFELVEVSFEDASRHIKGTVKMLACELAASQREIGRTVLFWYDQGKYQLV